MDVRARTRYAQAAAAGRKTRTPTRFTTSWMRSQPFRNGENKGCLIVLRRASCGLCSPQRLLAGFPLAINDGAHFSRELAAGLEFPGGPATHRVRQVHRVAGPGLDDNVMV